MFKHLLKACGVLSIVFFSSLTVSAQTTWTITNDNTCDVDYTMYYGPSSCVGFMASFNGSCAASSSETETIPDGSKFIKCYVVDPSTSGNITVYRVTCGTTSGIYNDCNVGVSSVTYYSSGNKVVVDP